MIFFAPIYGTLSDVVGMLVVFATGFLGLGAIVITSVYGVISIFTNSLEVTLLVIALDLLMISRHYRAIGRMIHGKEPQILKLFGRKRKEDESDD